VLLQQEVGVDIRQRGPAGTQADLYIRGGGFDQTLLLIDGIKLEDAQTGHHLLSTRYSETNLVPMPLANGFLTVGYDF